MPERITVAIPTYQGGRFLRETLESVLGQSRRPDQVVLSDDGSSDGTLGIAQEFARGAPFRVDVREHRRAGITDNYLHAVSASVCDIVVIADQDDLLHPERLRLLEAAFTRYPEATLIAGDSAFADGEGRPLGGTLRGGLARSRRLSKRVNEGDDLTEFLRGGVPLLAHTVAFRSLLKAQLLEKPSSIEEWWFEEWVAYVALCSGRLALVPESLTFYRQHAGQTTARPKGGEDEGRRKVGKYDLRIRKLRYCLSWLSDDAVPRMTSAEERERRRRTLESYVRFLGEREGLSGVSRAKCILRACVMLLRGSYHRYARGTRSWALDVASIVMS